jgi:ribosome-associated protein
MIVINAELSIPEEEVEWSFVRSGGPGGQNVNKVASRAVLRWRLGASTVLPEEARRRLLGQQRRRITTEGDLLIQSQRYRDQARNREDCLDKLRDMILQALHVPRPRRATRPTLGSKLRRLTAKKRRGEIKQGRRDVLPE